MTLNDRFEELAVRYAKFHGEVRLYMNETKDDINDLKHEMASHKKDHSDAEKFARQLGLDRIGIVIHGVVALGAAFLGAYARHLFQ